MTVDDPSQWLDDNVTTVRTEGATPDGVVIGKHLRRSKFERSLPLGPAISDIAFGYDIGGTPYFGWWGDWRQACLGDVHQRPDLTTTVVGADRPGMASVIVDFVDVTGEPLPVCSRSTLRRVVERLGRNGLSARAAFEIEGMVFFDAYDEARGKGFRNLRQMGVSAPVGYLTHDAKLMTRFMDEVVWRLDGIGIPWEAWSAEAAPGQFELNLEPADPVAAADMTMRTKQIVREVAIDLGHCATFMAKPLDAYGNGMHIHHSVTGEGGAGFYDERADDHRSPLMRHWIGGLMATMPATQSILTPTINSYRRLVGFVAAPTVVSWGEENKSVALRVISRSAKLARVEHRVGSADLNPYLALAAVLAGGIAGVEGVIEPPDETTEMAWGLPPDRFAHLPRSITAAANALENDKLLVDILGAATVDHWVNTRRWEWLMFHTTGGDPDPLGVSDWELSRYFELV